MCRNHDELQAPAAQAIRAALDFLAPRSPSGDLALTALVYLSERTLDLCPFAQTELCWPSLLHSTPHVFLPPERSGYYFNQKAPLQPEHDCTQECVNESLLRDSDRAMARKTGICAAHHGRLQPSSLCGVMYLCFNALEYPCLSNSAGPFPHKATGHQFQFGLSEGRTMVSTFSLGYL